MQRTPKSGHQVKCSSFPDLSVEAIQDENFIRNINIRKRKNPELDQFIEIKYSLLQTIKEMFNSEMLEIKNQNMKIMETNNEIIKLLQKNEANYKELREKVEILEKSNATAIEHIRDLEVQLNDVQKSMSKNKIEIRNVPREENENSKELVKNIYTALQVEYVNDVNIYRKGKFNAPIIIEYHDLKEKDMLLKAFKRYNSANKDNPLNTENIGFGRVKSKIYISEYLTPMSKKLLGAARDLVKNGTFKYCWTSRGNILLRKEEGRPAIVIKSLNQIKELISF